mgnify:CR=1 FL=1
MRVKYSEILSLYDYFKPAYDLTEETQNSWKQFIPVSSFVELLKAFLTALESDNPKEKMSIWLQGKYGVGKSHATSVVKHLLWDPWEDVADFVEHLGKLDVQVQKKLENYRQKNRVFPVVLKGSSSINDGRSFNLALQNAVKNALQHEGLDITLKTDFELYKNYILDEEKYGHNWDSFLEDNLELKAMVGSRDGLLMALDQGNVEVFKSFQQALNVMLPTNEIDKWLTDIVKILKDKGIASAVTIYWDEFTSVLDIQKRAPEILASLQNIAERTFSSDIYLFIVSHRSATELVSTEDEKKVLDRFITKSYKMEELTTYDIIAHAIKKSKQKEWEILKDYCLKKPSLSNLILRLSASGGLDLKKMVTDVFPIHPYTAFLSAKLADFVGSSERTIFSFLYDEETGFKGFIQKYPQQVNDDTEYFLTADTLWDFFVQEFENYDDEKIRSVLGRFNLYRDKLDKKGPAYGAVFRVILLLNALLAIVETRVISEANLFLPTEQNIKAAFAGTVYEDSVQDVLDYVLEQEILDQTPDGLYEVVFSNLPEEEVKKKKTELGSKYGDIAKAIRDYPDISDELTKAVGANVIREVEVRIYGATMRSYDVKRALKQDFQKPYTLKVALFVGKNDEEIRNMEEVINDVLNDSDDPNHYKVALLLARTPMGDREFERFITYKAQSYVAKEHGYQTASENEKWARTTIEKFKDAIIKGMVTVYLDIDKERKDVSFGSLSVVLNDFSKEVFKFGLENIRVLTENKNIWDKKRAEKVAQNFLSSQNLEHLMSRSKSNARYGVIMRMFESNSDYIIDKKLQLKKEYVESDYPVAKICNIVGSTLKKERGTTFNLGSVLKFLSSEPYGLYPNEVSTAVLAFALRPFIEKLYEANSGIKITADLMARKVTKILDSFDNGSVNYEDLQVRLGSEEEGLLIKLLSQLFGFGKDLDLAKARWSVRKWFTDKAEVPVWILKYVEDIKTLDQEINNLSDGIGAAMDMLVSSVDRELKQDVISSIYNVFAKCEPALSKALDVEKLKSTFENWLMEQKDVASISKDDLQDVRKFLEKNMQEEVALWKEEKVKSQLEKWQQGKEASEKENQLSRILSKIFRLEEQSPDVSKTLQNIRKKINTEIGFPVWIFQYFYSDPDLQRVVKSLNDLVTTDASPDLFDYGKYVSLLNGSEDVLAGDFTPIVGGKAFNIWAERSGCSVDVNVQRLDELVNIEPWRIKEDDLANALKLRGFVQTAANLFEIRTSGDIESLRSGIYEWLESMDCPYWFFIEAAPNDGVRNLLSKIFDIARGGWSKPDTEELHSLTKQMKYSEVLLKTALNPENRVHVLRSILADCLDPADMSDDNLWQMLREMRQRMKDVDFYWDRDKFISDLNRRVSMLVSERKKEKIREAIEHGLVDARTIIMNLMDEHPEIYEWLADLGLGD